MTLNLNQLTLGQGCTNTSPSEAEECYAAPDFARATQRSNVPSTQTMLDGIVSNQASLSTIYELDPYSQEYINRAMVAPTPVYSSFLTAGEMVPGFGDCQCNGPYTDVGCGCDCNPQGFDYKRPSSGYRKCGCGMMPILIIIAIVILVIFLMMKKK